MTFKLIQSAQKRLRRIFRKSVRVVSNVKFQNGEQVIDQSERKAA